MGNDTAFIFDILIEEIENLINELSQDGARAFQNKDLSEANQLAQKGEQMTIFRAKIMDLKNEWISIIRGKNMGNGDTIKKDPNKRKKRKRLKRGLRTAQNRYYEPILKALITLGGKGSVREVLELVESYMKSELNQYDIAFLPSGSMRRWENAANWTRRDMVQQGLLSSDSDRGVWEITEKGKSWLVTVK